MRDDPRSQRPKNPPQSAQRAARPPPPRITSKALLGTARELIIEHEGRDYRLRLTQQGKLILTA